ncbi:MAG: hypothetical protein V4487_05555 [Chlamydiota bacterium]
MTARILLLRAHEALDVMGKKPFVTQMVYPFGKRVAIQVICKESSIAIDLTHLFTASLHLIENSSAKREEKSNENADYRLYSCMQGRSKDFFTPNNLEESSFYLMDYTEQHTSEQHKNLLKLLRTTSKKFIDDICSKWDKVSEESEIEFALDKTNRTLHSTAMSIYKRPTDHSVSFLQKEAKKLNLDIRFAFAERECYLVGKDENIQKVYQHFLKGSTDSKT